MNDYRIITPYGRAPIDLLSAPSSKVELQRGQVESVDWASPDRPAVDLEVRIAVLGLRQNAPRRPIFQWALEYGHGQESVRAPQLALSTSSSQDQVHRWSRMPTRGTVRRLACRWCRVFVRYRMDVGEGPGDESTALLRVSIQPVLGPQMPLLPTVERPDVLGDRIVIPPEATLIQASTADDWTAQGGQFTPFDINGVGLGQRANSTIGTPAPIDPDAVYIAGNSASITSRTWYTFT